MADLPIRIQRKRTKGFKLPTGCICCTRPGPWGNPWAVRRVDNQWAVVWPLTRVDYYDDRESAVASALELFRDWLRARNVRERFRAGLAGAKFLACWCPVESPNCHVEIIREVLRDA